MTPMEWSDCLFSRWKWYRRWRGSHWECWWIGGQVQSWLWFRERIWPDRPGLGRGRSHVEDYDRQDGPGE